MAGADTHGLRTLAASAAIIFVAWCVVWATSWPLWVFGIVAGGTVVGGLFAVLRRKREDGCISMQASTEPEMSELSSSAPPSSTPPSSGSPSSSTPSSSGSPSSSAPTLEPSVPAPYSTNPVLRKLEEAYESGNLLAFVGSGVSLGAGLPTGEGLVAKVHDYARDYGVSSETLQEVVDSKAKGKLSEALALLERELGKSVFVGAVQELLEDKEREIPHLAEALASLAPRLRAVLTTNLDRLLERAFPSEWVPHHRPLQSLARGKHFILKLHGTLHDASTWILTREQYDRAMYADPRHQPIFRALMLGAPMLFVGFGLDDADLNAVLGEIRAMAQGQPPRHFALVPEPIRSGQRRAMAEAGVMLVGYDNSDGTHTGAVKVLEALSKRSAVGSEVLQPRAARQRLRQLLTHVFSIDELKKIVMFHKGFGGDAVFNAVDWECEGWVDSLIDVCGSEGAMPAAFFEALLKERPDQEGEIRVLKQYWTRAGTVSPQVPSVPSNPTADAHSGNVVPTRKVQPGRALTPRMRRVALFLDRSAYWDGLKVACTKRTHVGAVIHGATAENIELFLERIKSSFNTKEELNHGYVEVPLILEERHALVAEDWGNRICKVLRFGRRVGLARGLKKQTRNRPLVLLFTGTGGPLFSARRGVRGGLTQQEQDGLFEFLSSYLPSKLAGVSFKHPVRLIVPIEYPPDAGPTPKDAFFKRIRSAFDIAQGIEHVKIQPIAGIPWSDVWHTIEFEFRGHPPTGFEFTCKKEYDTVTKKVGYTFADVAEAIGALVDEAKEYGT